MERYFRLVYYSCRSTLEQWLSGQKNFILATGFGFPRGPRAPMNTINQLAIPFSLFYARQLYRRRCILRRVIWGTSSRNFNRRADHLFATLSSLLVRWNATRRSSRSYVTLSSISSHRSSFAVFHRIVFLESFNQPLLAIKTN